MILNVDEMISRLEALDEHSVGKFVNQVADSYRQGANLLSLIPLLEHSDPRLVSVAAWIASEVVDGIRGREIFQSLATLLQHSDPAVRFGVVESIALLAKPEDHSVVHRFLFLTADPNPGVRQQALYWLCQIPDSIVEPFRPTGIWPSVRLLLGNVSKDEIRTAIKSESLFDQRMAIAGAVRKFGNDKEFLQEILPFCDDEVLTTLPCFPLGTRADDRRERN